MADNGRYRAFISYSHDDQKTARWLHHALETYRIPSRLVGQTTRKGEVPRRLVPIFRDRDDLPASGDLSASVRDALGRSDTLIVVCSPSAATSRWVNEEIRAFREINPQGDILAAIVAGEPEAEAGGHPARLECFPPMLRGEGGLGAEPVAADFRTAGDGRRMALLKLVAGLLAINLDQLIQRDLLRRQRRVTAITGVSIILTLIMATLTLFAISARSEAERRKAEAEDLIEFMLSDLRLKLEPVGRLDVLDAVGEKVIEYYDEQNPRQMSADDLGRRARAFHLLGEIDSDKGDLDNAYRHFLTAYHATSRILAVEPSSPARIYEHSQSAFWVGYFAWRRSDLETAEARFLEYRDLARQLIDAEPDNLEWIAEAAYAHNNLCALYAGQGRLREAEAEIRRAIDLFMQIAQARPESEHAWIDAADAYGWLAQVTEPVNGREAAMEALRQQIGIYDEGLAGGAENWRLRRGAMAAEYALARLHIAQGPDSPAEEVRAALDILTAASHEADALVEHEPSNVEWRMLAARQRIWLAEAHLLSGDLTEAREAYLDATSFMAHPSWSTMEDIRYDDTRHHAALIEARIFLAMGDTDSAQLAPMAGRMPADTAAEYRRAAAVLESERLSAE